jgi:hypothetical protein
MGNILYFVKKFHSNHLFRYSCFYTPEPKSPCFSFKDDSENFKGPDGLLLCYKTQLFDEINRYAFQQPEDISRGKQVHNYVHKKFFYFHSSFISFLQFLNYNINHHQQTSLLLVHI